MQFLIFLGPPGSGKGTQADILASHHWMKISTGDLLRENIKNDTEIGKRVAGIMNKGILVSDEIVFEIIKDKIAHTNNPKFLLDGFPRNAAQALLLDTLIEEVGANYQVFLVDLSDEEIVKRNTGRRICKKCNRIYNIHYSQPREFNKCDKCGTELITRKDDAEDIIRKRIDVYKSEMNDLLKFYNQKKGIVRIDGSLSASEIHNTILTHIEDENR